MLVELLDPALGESLPFLYFLHLLLLVDEVEFLDLSNLLLVLLFGLLEVHAIVLFHDDHEFPTFGDLFLVDEATLLILPLQDCRQIPVLALFEVYLLPGVLLPEFFVDNRNRAEDDPVDSVLLVRVELGHLADLELQQGEGVLQILHVP